MNDDTKDIVFGSVLGFAFIALLVAAAVQVFHGLNWHH